MDLLVALNSFVRVVETGSFSAVSRESGLSQSVVTRQIGQLEEHFGVRLLHRTTRRLSLTDDGTLLVGYARQLVQDASAMEQELGQHRTTAIGAVRLGTPTGPGLFLAPRIPELLREHPGVSVELVVCDEPCDMIESRLDLALLHGKISDSSLVARQVGVFGRAVVASPSYLERNGMPGGPEELERHVCILQGGDSERHVWNFNAAGRTTWVRVAGPLATNNERLALLMARSGAGIACLPEMQVFDDVRSGRLVRLMPDCECEPVAMHVAYPSRRHLALKTRVVLDFVVDAIRSGFKRFEQLNDEAPIVPPSKLARIETRVAA